MNQIQITCAKQIRDIKALFTESNSFVDNLDDGTTRYIFRDNEYPVYADSEILTIWVNKDNPMYLRITCRPVRELANV